MSKELLREDRLKQLKYLEDRGINPYPGAIPDRDYTNDQLSTSYESLKGQSLAVVGRITAIREHGSRVFFDLEDGYGKVQATLTKDGIGEEVLEIFKRGYAPGDFIGVRGELFRTKSGEITLNSSQITMLTKSLLPPPANLKDVETRSRQRYIDLMVNREVRERFKLRSQVVEFMRQRFIELGCTEVETPVMDSTYGGAAARPFITRHNALDMNLFLRISNELYLKRLLVGGFEGVFEFSRDFRNEGMDATHNPEFTQVELYKGYTDYDWMMAMSENLIADSAAKLLGRTTVQYGEHTINLKAPWRRLSIYDGLKQYLNIDPETISEKELLALAKKNEIKDTDPGYIFVELFDKHVSPKLIDPTFVIDYPESTSPLTKKHRVKPGLVERFECVVAGMEVMNCYTELNDPRKQRANFEEELKRKAKGDEEAMLNDDDFVVAMEYGMPPMGGIGISIDRWTMLLSNAQHIREVILFPTMKPLPKNSRDRK